MVSRADQVLVFTNTPYEFWVSDAAPLDSDIGQVEATGFGDLNIRYFIQHNLNKPGTNLIVFLLLIYCVNKSNASPAAVVVGLATNRFESYRTFRSFPV